MPACSGRISVFFITWIKNQRQLNYISKFNFKLLKPYKINLREKYTCEELFKWYLNQQTGTSIFTCQHNTELTESISPTQPENPMIYYGGALILLIGRINMHLKFYINDSKEIMAHFRRQIWKSEVMMRSCHLPHFNVFSYTENLLLHNQERISWNWKIENLIYV